MRDTCQKAMRTAKIEPAEAKLAFQAGQPRRFAGSADMVDAQVVLVSLLHERPDDDSVGRTGESWNKADAHEALRDALDPRQHAVRPVRYAIDDRNHLTLTYSTVAAAEAALPTLNAWRHGAPRNLGPLRGAWRFAPGRAYCRTQA